MTVYWTMLLLPALFAITPIRLNQKLQPITWWIFGSVLIIIIGLRHEVGGDWIRYLDTAYGIQKGTDLDFSLLSGDSGYRLIHWFSVNYLNGIYATNFICAIFFILGLVRFSRSMPIPWIALLASIPFLVIVVSMGYTRQAAAAGFLMWGLVDLIREKKISFYIAIIIGSFLHFTLLIMLPVGLIYGKNKSIISKLFLVIFPIVLLLGYLLFFKEIVEHMLYYYVEINFHHSSGAYIRTFMGFVSAIIFFIFRKKFKEKFYDENLWLIFSIVSILLFLLSFFYSTFADRIAIYFIPLQLVIYSRIPILIKSTYNRTVFILCFALIYTSTLFVWLNFGSFSGHWLPYQNLLTL